METAKYAVGIARKGAVKRNTKEPVGAGKKVADVEPTISVTSSGVSEQSYACLLRLKLYFGLVVTRKMVFCYKL